MAVDKSATRVQRMFGEIAPRYDRMNHLLSMNFDRYWRWRTVRLAPPRGESPILDVCTGTGDLALAYYRRTGGQVAIFATDFCPQMLAIGEDKKRRAGINGNLTFLEADTQSLPFQEMCRVCETGGRVAILEFSMPQHQPWKMMYGFYFRRILPRLGQLFARNTQHAYRYLPESVGEFPQGNALADRMRAAGMREVAFWPLTLGVATLYVGTK
jgi:demethylmenaquinone methyltransferase/2-methoxy-6-polyprenyl-1,4-benzoquinol methylase